MRRVWLTGVLGIAMMAVAGTARADWLITPFLGWNFGGSADVSGCVGTACGVSTSNKFEHKIDYGVSLAAMGAGIAGFEVEAGYSPNFFATDTASNNTFRFTNTSNVVTLMGNLILGAPVGGHGASVRPYAVAGVGLIRTNVQDFDQTFSVDTKNDFGFDAGAGVMGFFTNVVGLRGDVRYFRGFTGSSNATGLGLSNFQFWRGSVGVVFKF
ncbi:MAG: outer membrane protein [Vicinamibacterales bacterium]